MYIPICVNCLYSIVKFRVHVAEGEGRPAGAGASRVCGAVCFVRRHQLRTFGRIEHYFSKSIGKGRLEPGALALAALAVSQAAELGLPHTALIALVPCNPRLATIMSSGSLPLG